jgi:hypothetical protein
MSNHEETRGGKPKGSDLLTFEEKKVLVALLSLYIDGNFSYHCIDINCSL